VTSIALRDHVKRCRVVQDVVVERELATIIEAVLDIKQNHARSYQLPGDEVDAPLLDAGPASFPDIGGGFSQLIGRDLASPVGLNGLFDFTVRTYVKAS
jgi:hypothetical protein